MSTLREEQGWVGREPGAQVWTLGAGELWASWGRGGELLGVTLGFTGEGQAGDWNRESSPTGGPSGRRDTRGLNVAEAGRGPGLIPASLDTSRAPSAALAWEWTVAPGPQLVSPHLPPFPAFSSP